MQCHYTEQRFSISPTYVVSTPVYSGGSWVRSKKQRQSESNLQKNDNNGILSKKAATKMRNAVNWLLESATWKTVYSKTEQKHFRFKVNFITLTVPKIEGRDISSKELKALLHNWLVYSRKYFYMKNYVWKIERGKLGKLHIHLTTDTFIHYRKLRDSWNRLLMKSGYSDTYYSRTGHYDPNSTDVHSVKSIKNLAGYICKYMSKETELGADWTGRLWGCNYELSAGNKCSYIADPSELAEVSESLMKREIRYSPILSKPDSMGGTKRLGEIFFVNTDTWSRHIKGKIKDAYDNHRFYIRSQTPKPPKEYYEYGVIISQLPTIYKKRMGITQYKKPLVVLRAVAKQSELLLN